MEIIKLTHCPFCQTETLEDKVLDDEVAVGDHTFTGKIHHQQCSNCGEQFFPASELERFEDEASSVQSNSRSS